MKIKKKLGFGTIALLMSIWGILFATTFRNGFIIGDYVINSLGLKSWSNGSGGIHYTIFYGLIFFVIAIILGHRFEDDFGAKAGKIISICMFFMIIAMSLFII